VNEIDEEGFGCTSIDTTCSRLDRPDSPGSRQRRRALCFFEQHRFLVGFEEFLTELLLCPEGRAEKALSRSDLMGL